MIGAGGVGHHEGLLERGERGAELLRHPRYAGGGLVVEGVSTLAGVAGAGGAGGDALRPAGVLVGLEDEAPLRGPLRGAAHGSILVFLRLHLIVIRGDGEAREERGGGLIPPRWADQGGRVWIEDFQRSTGVAWKSCTHLATSSLISLHSQHN